MTEARLAAGASRLASLDAPFTTRDDDAGDTGLADTLGRDDDGLDRVENALWLEQLSGALTDRQREVLRLRFVEDLVQRGSPSASASRRCTCRGSSAFGRLAEAA